jgi:signal transduction histidine kinase
MMKKFGMILLTGLLLVGFVGTCLADSKSDATALVDKAIAYYKANGKDKALAEISNKQGQFVKGELYVFIWSPQGVILAHGPNEKLIGKNMFLLKDSDGKQFVKDAVELASAKGTGWVDYKWANPVSKKVEAKTTFVKKVDDLIFACGIYK